MCSRAELKYKLRIGRGNMITEEFATPEQFVGTPDGTQRPI
jgi:hypothetical protein